MTIIGIGLDLANNSFTRVHYKNYNGTTLDQSAKQDILDLIPENGLEISSSGNVQIMSFAYDAFAFSISASEGVKSTVAEEVFDLLLNGNELGRLYSFKPITGEAVSYAHFAVSYGHPFDLGLADFTQTGLGLSLKYIRGLAYGKIVESHAMAYTGFKSIVSEGSFLLHSATGGAGFGMDVGATTTYRKKWRISLCLENIVSGIHWNKNPEVVSYDFDMSETNVLDLMSEESDADSAIVFRDSTYALSDFSTNLPTILRIGTARSLGKFVLAAEWEQGFRTTALASASPRFAIGGEYKPLKFLKLRLGSAIGGGSGFIFACGLGFVIGPVTWDFAGRSIRGFPIGRYKGLGLATNISIGY